MKNIIILVLIFFCNTQINAQRSQVIYAELGGAGILYTVNYDTRFSDGEDKLGARVGIGVVNDAIIIPLHLNYLIGAGNHKFEVGGGVTAFFIDINRSNNANADVLASGALMYRFQKIDGHLLLRAGLSPTIALSGYNDASGGDVQKIFWFWPGISIGYKF